MRHEHLVVTVEAGVKERIDDDLDAGESLESWVADAIERKLERTETGHSDPARIDDRGSPAESGATGSGPKERFGTSSDDERSGRKGGGDDGDNTDDGDEAEDGDDLFGRTRDVGFDGGGEDDEYDEGFEYVDDCSI